MTHLAVVGAHLTGMPLNHQLTDLRALLVETTTTAASYRLYALATDPPKPGMVRVPADGVAVACEVWQLGPSAFGRFVDTVPSPLTIGNVELLDGRWVNGFLAEPHALHDAHDISHHGGWARWLSSAQTP